MADCREVAIGMIRLCEDDPRDVACMARDIMEGMFEVAKRRDQKMRDGSNAVMIRYAKKILDEQYAPWFELVPAAIPQRGE